MDSSTSLLRRFAQNDRFILTLTKLAFLPGIPYLYINAASCSGDSVLCMLLPVLAIRAGFSRPSHRSNRQLQKLVFCSPDGQVSIAQGIRIHLAVFYHIPLNFASFKSTQKRGNTHNSPRFPPVLSCFLVFSCIFSLLFHENCIFAQNADVNFASSSFSPTAYL